MKTMKQVIEDHLRHVGADGLFNQDMICGCGLGDLIPCGCDCSDCVPATNHVVTQADLEDESLNLCDPEIGDIVYFAMKDKHKTSEKRGEA